MLAIRKCLFAIVRQRAALSSLKTVRFESKVEHVVHSKHGVKLYPGFQSSREEMMQQEHEIVENEKKLYGRLNIF
jgi:hypothetical protein